jgi:hypothetical protein
MAGWFLMDTWAMMNATVMTRFESLFACFVHPSIKEASLCNSCVLTTMLHLFVIRASQSLNVRNYTAVAFVRNFCERRSIWHSIRTCRHCLANLFRNDLRVAGMSECVWGADAADNAKLSKYRMIAMDFSGQQQPAAFINLDFDLTRCFDRPQLVRSQFCPVLPFLLRLAMPLSEVIWLWLPSCKISRVPLQTTKASDDGAQSPTKSKPVKRTVSDAKQVGQTESMDNNTAETPVSVKPKPEPMNKDNILDRVARDKLEGGSSLNFARLMDFSVNLCSCLQSS